MTTRIVPHAPTLNPDRAAHGSPDGGPGQLNPGRRVRSHQPGPNPSAQPGPTGPSPPTGWRSREPPATTSTYTSDGGKSWSLAALNHEGNSITINRDGQRQVLHGGGQGQKRARRQRLAKLPQHTPVPAHHAAGHPVLSIGDQDGRFPERRLARHGPRHRLPRHLHPPTTGRAGPWRR